MASGRRVGGGGVAFVYTQEEEARAAKEKVLREFLPLMGDVLLGVIDGQPAAPPTASVEPKMLKAGRKKATVTEEPAQVETPAKEPSEHEVKVARLRELHQELLKSR